jgi:erlin
MQTDSVLNVPCGVSGGSLLEFARIEVVNRLRAEKVYDTVREYGVSHW